MKTCLKVLIAGLILNVGSAFADTRIDTSSEEAAKASLQKILTELSPEDQKKFKDSIEGIYMLGMLSTMGSSKTKAESAAMVEKRMMELLDGKTAEDVFEMVREIKRRMNEKG